MNVPVNSTLLTHIIACAKAIGSGHINHLSCERLFVVLADHCTVTSHFVQSHAEEFAPFTYLVQIKKIDLNKLRSELYKYISKDKSYAAKDSEFISFRLQEARTAAAARNSDTVLLSDLISAVLKKPSPVLMQALLDSMEKNTADNKNNADNIEIDKETYRMYGENRNKFSNLTDKAKKMQQTLLNIVFGQDNAVKLFTEGYFRGELLSLTDDRHTSPKAAFIFAGPSGVGKTFLAQKAAELLGLPAKLFDMSEYSTNDGVQRLCGHDPSYQNASEGSLTGFVGRNPQSVIIFDEIEKANMNVIQLFLQILDGGRLKDNYLEKEISFVQTIIIFTTNAGRQLYENSDAGDYSSFPRKVILKALENDTDPQTDRPFFPAAICSRFAAGNVVMFNRIEADTLCRIEKNEFNRHAANFKEKLGVSVETDERVFTALMFSEGGNADARTIRSRAEAFFSSEIFELFRMVSGEDAEHKISDIEKIRFSVKLPDDSPEIGGLFEKKDRNNILIFSSEQWVNMCKAKVPDCGFMGASSVKKACEMINKNEISFALVDVGCGRNESQQYLNVEDENSAARDLLKCLRENYCDLPVFILQTNGEILSSEERLSFTAQGVRGVLSLPEKNPEEFRSIINMICTELHRQQSMQRLARSNKVVTFSSAQRLHDNGRLAEILLFDFKICTAVEAEDSQDIVESVSKPDVRFDDIIGAEDVKKELRYFVEYLKNPGKYLSTGVSAPKGVILYGPPGTGKTMLAKAMASESDITFIATEGNRFLKKYVGESPAAVHKLFATARKYAPTVLFIDEIDCIGRIRNGSEMTAVREEVLTAFLTEMDGFKRDVTKPVFVLAATNYDAEPDSRSGLDPALLRRFDRRIYIDLPDRDDRLKYMRQKIADNPAFAISCDKLDNIAVRSTGMSLAQLESVFELALRTAIRDGNFKVTDEIFDEAFEIFNNGEMKKWDAPQLQRTARHESGHALLSWLSGDKPSYVTVAARGDHGGYMQHSDNEDKHIYTKSELEARICTALGGRAAEIVYYGREEGISTSASSDLELATQYAQQIVCKYGMDEDMGLAVIDIDGVRISGLTSQVRSAVNRILSEQMNKAEELITANRAAVDALSELLMTKNHLSGNEIDEVLRKTTVCQ